MKHVEAGALLLAATLVGCNPSSDDGAFASKKGNLELKPTSTLSADGSGLGDAANAAPTTAASVTYELRISSASGSNLCTGAVDVQIMSNFAIKIPAGKLQCVSLSIDLGAMLAGLMDAGGMSPDSLASLADGRILALKSLAGATFDPPRPLLLGPIIQDASRFNGLDQVFESKVSTTDAKGNQLTDVPGSFHVKVLQAQTTYSNKYISPGFTKVIQWEIDATGFDGVPATKGLLLRHMQWLYNTNPIMIPRISIQGRLGDFISGAGSTDALLGDVTVDLIVKKYDMR